MTPETEEQAPIVEKPRPLDITVGGPVGRAVDIVAVASPRCQDGGDQDDDGQPDGYRSEHGQVGRQHGGDGRHVAEVTPPDQDLERRVDRPLANDEGEAREHQGESQEGPTEAPGTALDEEHQARGEGGGDDQDQRREGGGREREPTLAEGGGMAEAPSDELGQDPGQHGQPEDAEDDETADESAGTAGLTGEAIEGLLVAHGVFLVGSDVEAQVHTGTTVASTASRVTGPK